MLRLENDTSEIYSKFLHYNRVKLFGNTNGNLSIIFNVIFIADHQACDHEFDID